MGKEYIVLDNYNWQDYIHITTGVTSGITGSTVGVVNKTYEELKSLYNTSGLTAGQFYRITDFATAHNIIGTSTQ